MIGPTLCLHGSRHLRALFAPRNLVCDGLQTGCIFNHTDNSVWTEMGGRCLHKKSEFGGDWEPFSA